MFGIAGSPDERLIPFLEMTAPEDGYRPKRTASRPRQRPRVAAKNLDLFFQKVYEYFEERGLWRMIVSRLTSLLILAFTVVFSTFLLLLVNWHDLLNCHAAQTCAQIAIVRPNPFASPSLLVVVVVIYFVVFALYWVWNVVGFLQSVRDGLEMRVFYAQKLGIIDDALQTMDWADVVERIEQLQTSYTISIIKDHDALDIAHRILRKDNYFVAMVSGCVLDLNVPLLSSRLHLSSVLGKSLEWNIRFCILESMFQDDLFTVRDGFLRQPHKLRRLFVQMAVANFVLMPFILIFMIFFFFLKNAEELHSRRSYLGPRQWSLLAEWTFREFNELPHVFRARLDESHNDALAYVHQFPVPVYCILAQLFAYVAGAVVAVLLLITANDSAILMEIQFLDHTLLYYLLWSTAVLAICRSISAHPKTGQDYQRLMANVFRHTHHQPRLWREQPHSSLVRSQFARLYPFKVVLFFQEAFCVLVTPLVLGITLPAATDRLIAFVRQNTVRLDGVGDVCAFAAYDFSQFRYNGLGAVREKMEKSLVSFAVAHPKWHPDRTGARLLTNLADQAQHRLHPSQHHHAPRGCPAPSSKTHEMDDDEEAAAGELTESTLALAMNISEIEFAKRSASDRKAIQQALIESVVLAPGDRHDAAAA